MSARHWIHCNCGFRRTICVGGTRRSARLAAYFPHHCVHCGLVEVNVAQEPRVCPQCGSPDVTAYGQPPLAQYGAKEHPTLQCGVHVAQRQGNFCPQCQRFTLCFDPPDILFD